MDTSYPHIAERIFGRAHAIEPEAFRAILESPLARRILAGNGDGAATGAKKGGKAAKTMRDIRRERLSATVEGEWCREGGEYFLTSDGVAIVPVCGVLSLRFDWLAALCGWTTYEGLSQTFDAMSEDYRVKAVLMDVESPGGEAAGMLDIADKIIAARSDKPIWAVANAYAFSAAYAVAGSAERLYVPRLCQVGSIGAVAIHLDQSAADKQMGLKYTAVYSGARKIDGWNHAPLSDHAQAAMQERIDYCRGLFADLVGRQGRISSDDAKATEANVYHDQPAVDAGLADAVGSFEDVLSELSDVAAGRPRSTTTAAVHPAVAIEGASSMADEKKPGQEQAGNDKTAATAATAGATPPPAAAAAPMVAPPAATTAKANKCPSCQHEWDDGEDDDKKQKEDAIARANADGVLELCATQGVSAAKAREYISAKTPLATVRAEIAADKARTADTARIDPTPSAATAASGWDKVIAKLPGFRAK